MELGITSPEALAPAANYVPYTISDNLVYVSGQVPKIGDKMITGKLGADADAWGQVLHCNIYL